MKTLRIVLLMSCFSFIFCQEKKEDVKKGNGNKEEFKKSKYFKEERIKDNKYNVKYNGDEHSFSELELYYSYNNLRKEELLPYALIIVEKYKKYKYCTAVFNNLIEFYTGKEFQYDGTEKSLILFLRNFEQLNIAQKQYVLYFLELGAENRDFGSLNFLKLLNREGIGMKKNMIKADNLQNIISSINKK